MTMSRIRSRIAVTAAALAVVVGASVATTGSAAVADTPTGHLPARYPTLLGCQAKGNQLAQQGQLTGYECVPAARGGYYLITY
jgi:hypothetical protein